MINHTSHRTVGILAGLTCSLGIILTAFMPSLAGVYVTYGITYGKYISGFGKITETSLLHVTSATYLIVLIIREWSFHNNSGVGGFEETKNIRTP